MLSSELSIRTPTAHDPSTSVTKQLVSARNPPRPGVDDRAPSWNPAVWGERPGPRPRHRGWGGRPCAGLERPLEPDDRDHAVVPQPVVVQRIDAVHEDHDLPPQHRAR